MSPKHHYNHRSSPKLTATLAALLFTILQLKDGKTLAGMTTATAPSSAPSAPVRIVTLPQGFVRVAAGNRTAMCEPADEIWVRDCLMHAPAGTQPSTQPSDLLSSLQAHKGALETQIAEQLALKDKQRASHFVVDTLLPIVQHLGRLRVQVIYLVATREDLKRLVIAGWGSDQFHYNRIADKIAFNGIVDISPDAVDGESIMPAPYLENDPISARSASLREDIGRTEAGVADMISRESQSAIQFSVAKFIVESGIAPLNLKLDENWFAAGVVGELSSEDMAIISGAQPHDIVARILQPDPNNPVSMSSIDLAHPIPPDQLRPAIAGAYADVFRRRSIGVIAAWSDRAGPDAIKKTLAAIRATPPSDGTALLELIRKTTGVDVSNELQPQ